MPPDGFCMDGPRDSLIAKTIGMIANITKNIRNGASITQPAAVESRFLLFTNDLP